MKLPDVNLLLYAVNEESLSHDGAREWLEAALSGTEAIAFAWMTLLGFLRISTNPAAIERPLPPDDALRHMDEWLAQPVATIVNPTNAHAATLQQLLQPLGTAGNLTSDAHLAALAIEHGGEVCSSDNDFARFEGLRWFNPLAA
ncbi:MAG TPA: type II toxin-antitoxin system VapC family toxin [Solirubrobacterales bacterium]|nr:type II toxin-antitoxin system VapC family toxin [Solirubrobacterales bacterium]